MSIEVLGAARARRSLAHFTYRARWALLFGFVALLVGAVLYGSGAPRRLVVSSFDDPESETMRTATRIETALGAGEPEVVLAYSHPRWEVHDPEFMRRLAPVLDRIRSTPGVEHATVPYGIGTDALVSDDGRTVIVTVQLEGRDDRAEATYDALEPHLRPEGLETLVGGALPGAREAQAVAEADLKRAELLALPLLGVLLVIFFRGVVVATLPLVLGAFSVYAALACIRLLTHFTEVSVFAMNIVTFVGLGVAVDYALFMTSRFRDELRAGVAVKEAVRRTQTTAGRTIGYSGLAVVASLLGMLVFPIPLLRSVAIAGSLVVLMAVFATLVVLPAALAVLGPRIEWLSFGRRKQAAGEWGFRKLASWAMRAPAAVTVAVTALLLFLGAPFLHIEGAVSGAAVLPHDAEARQIQELLGSGRFPSAATPSMVVLLTTRDPILPESAGPASLDAVERVADRIAELPEVSRVDSVVGGSSGPSAAELEAALAATGPSGDPVRARLSRMVAGHHTALRVDTREEPSSEEAAQLVRAVRALDVDGVSIAVTGPAARLVDLRHTMMSHLPWAIAIIWATTFVVLFLAFGSLVMPLTAIVVNLLSLTASFGALVWIFQDGRLERLLRFESPGNIELTVPLVMFAVLFGLAMDYELFLLSRIREAYDHTGDTRASVSIGVEKTGKIITRAAILLVAVMIGFISADMLLVKELGVGMAIAIAMDATIVRLLLVPAIMRLLGRYNWWAPRALARWWERTHLGMNERSAEEAASAR